MLGLVIVTAAAQEVQATEQSPEAAVAPGSEVPAELPRLQVIGEAWCTQRALWWDEDGVAHELVLGEVPLPDFQKDDLGVPHFGIYRSYTAKGDDETCTAGGALLYREISGAGHATMEGFVAAARALHEAVNVESDCVEAPVSTGAGGSPSLEGR